MPTLTLDPPDTELLREFTQTHSQEAFTQLVHRHADWVYSAAARILRDKHLAEDVTQAVFLTLSRRAADVGKTPLNAWLFTVTRYSCKNALRTEQRRQHHEKQAAAMQPQTADSSQIWTQIAPDLEPMVARLNSTDREAVLLRFYQQQSMPQIAASLNISPEAAKKRVARALESLRSLFRRSGTILPAADLAAALLQHTTHPAPAAALATTSSTLAQTIAQATRTTMFLAKLKFIAAILLCLSLVPAILASTHLLHEQTQTTTQSQISTPQSNPAPTPPPVTDAESALIPGLDPTLNPYIPKSSLAFISLDLSTVDVDALSASFQLALFRSPDATLKTTAQLSVATATAMTKLKQTITDLRSAGASKLYIFLRQPPAGHTSLNDLVTFIIPTNNQTQAQLLAKTTFASINLPNKTLDKALIVNPPPTLAITPAHETNRLPMFVRALSNSTDSALTCVSIPANITFKLQRSEKNFNSSFNLQPISSEYQVTWSLLSLQMPPAAALATTTTTSPSPTPLAWTLTYRCKSPAAAQAFAKSLHDHALDPTNITPTIKGTEMSLILDMQSIIASGSITTDGPRVTASLPFQQFLDLVIKVAYWQS